MHYSPYLYNLPFDQLDFVIKNMVFLFSNVAAIFKKKEQMHTVKLSDIKTNLNI